MTDPERDALAAKYDLILYKLDVIKDGQRDHESRIRSLERWKLSLPISIVLIIVGAIGGIIGRGGV